MIAAALALLLCAGAAHAAQAPLPSRPPEKGCVWRLLTNNALGLSLLVEKCDFGFRTVDYVSSEKEGAVYEVLHDTAPAAPLDSRDPVVYMFRKRAGESITAAIRRVALPSVPAERRKHCRAVPSNRYRLPPGREAYVFSPDDEAAIIKNADGDIPDSGCGQFGVDYDSQSYFEYHPKENPRRFAFVLFGQDDHPGFDENSLTFLP